MKGKVVLLLGSLAVSVLLLLFGCAPLLREDTGGGWRINLRVNATAGSKRITVSEYQVTGLEIKVRGPADEVLQTIDCQRRRGNLDSTDLCGLEELAEHRLFGLQRYADGSRAWLQQHLHVAVALTKAGQGVAL